MSNPTQAELSQEKGGESPFTLYTYFRSSCSARVRIALHWKKLQFQSKFVHLVKNEQTAEAYTQLNPMGEVPTLVHNGVVLTQSLAILDYLEEVCPENPLLPKDPVERAQVRALCHSIACDIQPVQNLRVLQKVGDSGKMEWGKHWITSGFEGLEKQLEKLAGKYCFGDNITQADLCLYPQVYNAERFQVDMTRFPNIQRIYQELYKVEAFQLGDWKNQADCPEDLRAAA